MSNRLSGSFGLAYRGTNADQPPNWSFETRNPTQYDVQNFSVGDMWLNSVSRDAFLLVSLAGDQNSKGMLAEWILLTGNSGTITELTGNSGGAVPPDVGGNINVVGDGITINIVGVPATNTLTASIIGGAPVQSLTTSDANVVTPTAGTIILANGNNITTTGTVGPNTVTISVSGTTNHNVQVGNASGSLTSVAPSATSGVPLISQGAAADPAFGTAVVAGGGTGATSFTAYAPVCGGTTSTNPLQSASTGLATSGFVLTSNGNAALPSFQTLPTNTFNQIVTQTFTSNGTYTPTSGMVYCIIEVVGGGGGGGGAPTTGAAQFSNGSGGGGGGYARKSVTAATIGVSQAVTVGAGGTAGTAAGANGGTGGTTSVGAIVSATGGAGGITSGVGGTAGSGGGAAGSGASGDLNASGNQGGYSLAPTGDVAANGSLGGNGGSSIYGGGGTWAVAGGGVAGTAGQNYGGGGGGAACSESSTGQDGGAGAQGIVVITEFVHA